MSGVVMADACVLKPSTAFAIAVALIFVVWFNVCSTAFGSHEIKNNYREHFGVHTRNWNTTESSYYDFLIDQRFKESSGGRNARLHYADLNVTREPLQGEAI